MAMSFAPVLASLNWPIEFVRLPSVSYVCVPPKLFCALVSVIAPLPELMAVIPLAVLIAPVCVIAPLAVTVRFAISNVDIDTPPSASALMSVMAMLFAPVLARVTAPRKSLVADVSVIAPAPALMVAAPAPVTIAVPAACRIAPLLVVMFSGPVTFTFDSVSGALAS